MLDANVQKVVNAGFSLDVAEWALRNSKNDPAKAIKELRAVSTCSAACCSLLSVYKCRTHSLTVPFDSISKISILQIGCQWSASS